MGRSIIYIAYLWIGLLFFYPFHPTHSENYIYSNQVSLDPREYFEKGKQLEKLFPDSAIYYYQMGLDRFGKEISHEDSFIKIQVLQKIGYIFHLQSKYSLANRYYGRALKESQSIGHDSLLAESYFSLAEVGLENGSFSTAIENYNRSIDIFKELNEFQGTFWSLIGLGIVYRESGSTRLSKDSYLEAIELAESFGRDDYVAISYNNLGNLYKQIGEYDTALEYLQESLKSFEIFGDEKFISDCLESIGEVYADIGNNNRAMEYFKESTQIAESLNDSYRLMSRYANMAKSFAGIGDNKNALMYFSKTVELAQSIGDKARLSEILVMISDYYRNQGDWENSLKTLNQSLRISDEVGDTVSLASAYNSLSDLHLLVDDFESAYESALKAYQISSQKELKRTLSKASLTLSSLSELKGNFEDALYYHKIYERTKDFLFNTEKLKILEDTEAKYNLEKIKSEKLELENSALINQEQLQEREIQILILVVSLLLIITFTGIYLNKRNREKRETLRKSQKMKEKITLLNDQLGEKNRELTTKALLISQNNEILKDAVQSISDYLKNDDIDKSHLNKLKNKLQQVYEETSWDDFIQHFELVHPKFYENLFDRCKDLSQMEQKVCAFLKMKLNTKDISQLTGQSVKAIEVMRSRIRKKLEIPHEESLSKIIESI